MARITIEGDLDKCGIRTEKVATGNGTIDVVTLTVVSITPKQRLHGLEKIQRSTRFSLFNSSINDEGGREALSGDLYDRKLKTYFGISANNDRIVLSPRKDFDRKSAVAFGKSVAVWFRTDVTVSAGDKVVGTEAIAAMRHPERLLNLLAQ